MFRRRSAVIYLRTIPQLAWIGIMRIRKRMWEKDSVQVYRVCIWKNCSTSYHVIILYHINTCHFFGTFFASDQLYWLNPRSFSLQPFIFFFPYDCLHPILSSSSCPLSLQQQHLEQLSIWPNNEGKDKYFVENRLLDCYIYIYILLIHFCLTSGSARARAVTWVN